MNYYWFRIKLLLTTDFKIREEKEQIWVLRKIWEEKEQIWQEKQLCDFIKYCHSPNKSPRHQTTKPLRKIKEKVNQEFPFSGSNERIRVQCERLLYFVFYFLYYLLLYCFKITQYDFYNYTTK